MRVISHFRVHVLFFTCLVIFNRCKPLAQADGHLTAVSIITQFPLVTDDKGGVKYYIDTITKFSYGSLVVYQLAQTREAATDEKIPGTSQYFVYKESRPKGYLFSSYNDSSLGKILNVDSMLKMSSFAEANAPVLPDSTWAIFRAEENDKKQALFEMYYAKTDNGCAACDSIYYYFDSRMNNLHHSLSHNLDSARRMKLYRIRCLFNEKFSTRDNVMLPKREFFLELFEPTVTDPKSITYFINRFKQSHSLYMSGSQESR